MGGAEVKEGMQGSTEVEEEVVGGIEVEEGSKAKVGVGVSICTSLRCCVANVRIEMQDKPLTFKLLLY